MRTLALIMLVLSVLLAGNVPAWGRIGQFVPKIAEYEGELMLDVVYESDENRSGGVGVKKSDTLIAERFGLSANGFVYHPRFIIFLARTSSGLKHEKFELGDTGSSLKTSTLLEYEFRTKFLPEHSYNLELFTTRRSPLIKGRFITDLNIVNYEKGAVFQYKKRPLYVNLSYILDTLSSTQDKVDSKTYSANATHFITHLSNSAGYSHTSSDSSFNTSNTSDYYFFNSQYNYKGLTLSSRIDLNDYTQESTQVPLLNDRTFSWSEQLTLLLPLNFDANLSFSRLRNKVLTQEAPPAEDTSGAPPREFSTFSYTDSSGLSISHRLFQSLITAYTISYVENDSTRGGFIANSQSVRSSYTKRIPGGVLRAGISARRSVTDRNGASTIIDELHKASLFSEVTLREQRIDHPTIIVKVKRPDTSFLVELTNDIHYSVIISGTRTSIRLESLPPEVLVSDVTYEYELEITYSTLQENTKIVTNDFGYTIKFELFDSLLNPFYSYYRSRQKVLEGEIAGGADDAITQSVGITIQRLPFVFATEYQETKSRLNPLKEFRSELDYRKDFALNWNVYGRIFYSKRTYPEGLPADGTDTVGQNINENLYGGNLRLQKIFPQKNLTLTLSSSYTQRSGNLKSRRYSMSSYLRWKIGKLDLTVGASASRSEGEFRTGSSELTTQYYYMSLRRKLF